MVRSKLSPEDVVANMFKPRIENKSQGEISGDPMGHCIIPRVNIDQLVPYNNNPRTSENPKYYEIKESIRHQGLLDKFTLTRRNPSDEKFMIRKGGNTRLKALRELWEETKDEQYYWLENLEFFPWKSEIDAFAGSMSENENRGNLLFIEKALAAVKLRDMFEEEAGQKLSNKDLKALIDQAGWIVDATDLGNYFFTAEHLEPHLHDMFWVKGIGQTSFRKIRFIHNRYHKLCRDKGINDNEYYTLMGLALEPVDEAFKEIGINDKAEFMFQDCLDKSIGAVLGIVHGDINSLARNYMLGSGPSGEEEAQPAQPEDQSGSESTVEPLAGDPSEDAVSRETAEESISSPEGQTTDPLAQAAKTSTRKPRQKSNQKTSEPPDDEPTRIDPVYAAERVKQMQQENRKFANRIVTRFEISSDVMEIDEGMGFLMTELRSPFHFEPDPDECTGYLGLHYFTKLTAMSLALHGLEGESQGGKAVHPQYHPDNTLANAFSEGILPGQGYQGSAIMLYIQRGRSGLGKVVDGGYLSGADLFKPLENNFFAIIEHWRAMGWQAG